ncbi:MAG: hypothetical protein AB8F65_08935 [Woeseiaceae bacterium]
MKNIYDAMDVVVENDVPHQILVTHGYALTFVIAHWIGLPIESSVFVNFRASPASITHLRLDGFWRNRTVVNLNSLSHLT